MCLVFAGMMAGTPIEGGGRTDFVTPINSTCYIVKAGAPVYEGGAADPLCRNYHPDLGIADGSTAISTYADLFWTEAVDEGELIFTGSLSYELYYSMYGRLKSYTTEDGGAYFQTRARVGFTESYPIRATLPGSGYGRFLGFNEPPPSIGQLLVPKVVVDFPVFRLGEEAVIAVINVDLPPSYLDENWWGIYNGGGYLLRWYSADAPASIPEPSTYMMLGTGLLGLWWRKRRRSRSDRPTCARSVKHLLLLTSLGGALSGAPTSGTAFSDEPLGPTLSCYIAAFNAGSQSTAYEGGAADPLCRNFHPNLGIESLETTVDSVNSAFGWDGDDAGDINGFLGSTAEFLLSTPLPTWEDTATGILYETRLRTSAINRLIPIIANIPGTGFGQFFSSGVVFSDSPIGAVPAFLSHEFPMFELGKPSTVAFLKLRVNDGGYLSHSFVSISGSAQSEQLKLTRIPSEVPEPSTAFLVLPALAAALAFRR